MKISIELDTLHDDKCLISQVLSILTQSQHKCNCHHSAPVVKKEEPAPASPEPAEPKKRRGSPKKQIPETCTCVVCNNEYKYGTLNKSGNVSVFTTSVQMYF